VLRGENPGYGQRELEGQDAKARIAAGVAGLLRDREHVWLDSGTTATEIARQLRQRELTLMPMSLRALNVLTEESHAGYRPALLVPGGSLIPGELCFRGPLAEANIRSLRFDTAVVTPCAVTLKDGLLAHDLDDAAVKRAGLESAGRVIAACAGSKWNAAAVALVAALDAVHVIVTDRTFSPQELTQLGKHSVKVVNV
jgi:DeoR/GlpR family transcriptional regulator of sugar metabolism